MHAQIVKRVSCIIPVYNRSHLLARTLRSVEEQGLDTDLVIVDNGSTEDISSAIKGASLANHIDVNYYRLEKPNANVARAFGLKACSGGQYIQFLDSDDILCPRKWELQIEHFQNNPKVQVSLSKTFKKNHEQEQTLHDPLPIEPRVSLSSFLNGAMHPITGAGLWQKEAASSLVWPGDLDICQDWESHLRGLLAGYTMEYCPKACYVQMRDSSQRLGYEYSVGARARSKLQALSLNFCADYRPSLTMLESILLQVLVMRLVIVCLRSNASLKGCWGNIRCMLGLHMTGMLRKRSILRVAIRR